MERPSQIAYLCAVGSKLLGSESVSCSCYDSSIESKDRDFTSLHQSTSTKGLYGRAVARLRSDVGYSDGFETPWSMFFYSGVMIQR